MQLYPIAERITEAVLIFDADAKVIDANTPSTKPMASNREELIGRSLEEVLSRLRVREGRLDLSRLKHATFRALKGQTVRDELQTYEVPGSMEIPLNMLISAEPLWADHGEITGATLVLRDVTDITRMQQRIIEAERQLILARIANGRNVLCGGPAGIVEGKTVKRAPAKQNWLRLPATTAKAAATWILRRSDAVCNLAFFDSTWLK